MAGRARHARYVVGGGGTNTGSFDVRRHSPILEFKLPVDGRIESSFIESSIREYLQGFRRGGFSKGVGADNNMRILDFVESEFKSLYAEMPQVFDNREKLEAFLFRYNLIIRRGCTSDRSSKDLANVTTPFSAAFSNQFAQVKDAIFTEFSKAQESGTEGYVLTGVTVDCLDDAVTRVVSVCREMVTDQDLRDRLDTFKEDLHARLIEIGDVRYMLQGLSVEELIASQGGFIEGLYELPEAIGDKHFAQQVGVVATVLQINFEVLSAMMQTLDLPEEPEEPEEEEVVEEKPVIKVSDLPKLLGVEKPITRACIRIKHASVQSFQEIFANRPLTIYDVRVIADLVGSFSLSTEEFLSTFDKLTFEEMLEALRADTAFDNIQRRVRMGYKRQEGMGLVVEAWFRDFYLPCAIDYFENLLEKRGALKDRVSASFRRDDLRKIVRGESARVDWLPEEDQIIAAKVRERGEIIDDKTLEIIAARIRRRCHGGVPFRTEKQVLQRVVDVVGTLGRSLQLKYDISLEVPRFKGVVSSLQDPDASLGVSSSGSSRFARGRRSSLVSDADDSSDDIDVTELDDGNSGEIDLEETVLAAAPVDPDFDEVELEEIDDEEDLVADLDVDDSNESGVDIEVEDEEGEVVEADFIADDVSGEAVDLIEAGDVELVGLDVVDSDGEVVESVEIESPHEVYVAEVEALFAEHADYVKAFSHPENNAKIQAAIAVGITLYNLLAQFVDTPKEYTIPQVRMLVALFKHYVKGYDLTLKDDGSFKVKLAKEYERKAGPTGTLGFFETFFKEALTEAEGFGPKNPRLKNVQGMIDETQVKLRVAREMLRVTEKSERDIEAELELKSAQRDHYNGKFETFDVSKVQELADLKGRLETLEESQKQKEDEMEERQKEFEARDADVRQLANDGKYTEIGPAAEAASRLKAAVSKLSEEIIANAGVIVGLEKELKELETQVSGYAKYRKVVEGLQSEIEGLEMRQLELEYEKEALTAHTTACEAFLGDSSVRIAALEEELRGKFAKLNM